MPVGRTLEIAADRSEPELERPRVLDERPGVPVMHVDAEFRVRGTPSRTVAMGDIAFAAFTAHDLPDDVEPNLEAQVTWDPPNFTFPNGTHIAVVEVDTQTGEVEIVDYH